MAKKPAPSAPHTTPPAPPAVAGAHLAGHLTGSQTIGEAVTLPLTEVQPNPWNPNRMTPETWASLRYGMEHDGWLASQPLLVWGSDESGPKMVIIDGEHRWRMARELGMTHGPMVLLHGVSEAKAKSLTVAMNQRRGAFEHDGLEALLRSIENDIPDLALATGLGDEELAKLLAETEASSLGLQPSDKAGPLPQTEVGAGAGAGTSNPGGPPVAGASDAGTAQVRMVQLFLSTANIDDFQAKISALSKQYGTENVTDTVIEAVKRAAHTA